MAVEESGVAAEYNPFAEGFTDNPYPQYRALRAHDPRHKTMIGGYYLAKHADVFAVLRDNTLSVEDRYAAPTPMDAVFEQALEGMDESVFEQRNLSMLDRDPPDHDRLRKLVSRAFTPRRVAELAPRIEELVNEALDHHDGGAFEAIGTLAFPLPFQVISEMLGMPETDMHRIRDLSGTLVRSLEPTMDPEVVRAIRRAGIEFFELLQGVIAWKRDHPGDDLLTKLMEARLDADDPAFAEGDRLTDDELVAQLSLLFIAGHETTVNLIGNGLAALVRNPDQYALLREDVEGRIPNAVEEFLRYDPPVQNTRRIPIEDVTIGDTTIEKGSFLVCGLASANRDEDHFGPDSETLDITRSNAHDHLAFGGGVHYCLGANLAKLEARVAVGAIAQRYESIGFAGEPTMNGRINLRGFDTLPLSLG